MQSSQKPTARYEALVIQEVSDEVLVYDLKINRAHHLNQTATFVWKYCDGKNTVVDICKKYEQENRKPVSEDIIWLAIDQLAERDLLEDPLVVNFKGQTRREALKRISMTAVVILPIVTSLTAPLAAHAQSDVCPGSLACTCTFPATCTASDGCQCTQQSTCPAACLGGCSCHIPNGGISCNDTCRAA
jgi:hypothetical protein